MRQPHSARLAAWLVAAAALVALMVGVGGYTRLTRSGLSIVEWRPIAGALPPMSEASWQAAFAAYRATPEHRLVHTGIDLATFQSLYWVEWTHRLLGRWVVLFVALPTLVLTLRGRLERGLRGRLWLFTLLLAMQGVVGWLMVASGLERLPHVSPYRLALHLLLAITVLALLLREALQLLEVPRPAAPVRRAARVTLGVVVTTLALGALVAGLRAGHVCPTFPSMCGRYLPLSFVSPLSDGFTVQWLHRLAALSTLLAAIGVANAARAEARGGNRTLALGLPLLVLVQGALGAGTVLMHVPIALAVAHQVFATVVVAGTVALSRA